MNPRDLLRQDWFGLLAVALAAGAVGMRKVLRSDPSQAFSGAGA